MIAKITVVGIISTLCASVACVIDDVICVVAIAMCKHDSEDNIQVFAE